MSKVIWKSKGDNIVLNSSDSIGVKISKILNSRGIKDVNGFLEPTEEHLFSPKLFKNMDIATEMILKAIYNEEKILISYDADADGITSSTIMRRYLSEFTNQVDYIYNERSHGHGIYEQTQLDFKSELDMLLKLKENGKDVNDKEIEALESRLELNKENVRKIKESDLLIIIDSSSNDVETCKEIKDKFGTDVIILDHHDIEKENPHAVIVNHRQSDCKYPNKHLSGAGVVYKTIQVLDEVLESANGVDYYLDLVAVGMYADVMRMDILENRYFVKKGLERINNVGLMRILKGARQNPNKLDCSSIGFSVAPMINGVARLDNIKLAIDILMEDDDNVCKPIRLKMQKLNEERRKIQRETYEKYKDDIDASKKVIIISDQESNRGFNGLVAQQVASEYDRPVMIGRLYDGYLSGSFRSVNGFNLKGFLANSGLVDQSVGHNMAGGFTVLESNIKDLEKYIEDNMPSLDEMEKVIYYDIEIEADEVADYVEVMSKVNHIYGNGFPKVVTRVNNATIEEVGFAGKNSTETVKFKTMNDMEGIKFRTNAEFGAELGIFDDVDIVGEVKLNEWYNFGTRQMVRIPQIIIEDYKESE